MFGWHYRRPVVVHTQSVATQTPPLLRVVAWPPTLDRRSTWRDDRDRRQDAVQPHLTSFFLLRSSQTLTARPPDRPTSDFSASLQKGKRINCPRMHACVVNGCSYPTALLFRKHSRYRHACLCPANAVRPARPARMVMSPPPQQHARTQESKPCLPASRKHVRRGNHLLCDMDSAISISLLALHGRARLTHAWVLPRTWESYGMR